MVDPVQIQQIQQIVERATSGGATGPGKADPTDVAKLEQALATGAQQAQPSAAVTGAPPVGEGVASVDKAASPGDTILDGIDKLRASHSEAMAHAQEVLGKDGVSAQDMLKVQMELQRISLEQDLTGKVAGKANQSLDQLLKG